MNQTPDSSSHHFLHRCIHTELTKLYPTQMVYPPYNSSCDVLDISLLSKTWVSILRYLADIRYCHFLSY